MENEQTGKNIGYKAAVLILIAILVCSNVIQFTLHSNRENELEESIDIILGQFSRILATESIELDHFADELDVDYVYVKTIEPIGFINYTTIIDATGDTRGVRSILYNVTFNKLTKEEANGSIEVWVGKYTCDSVFTFDNAIANDGEPMQIGNIYRMYSLYRGYSFLSVIYYEQVETGRID